ncbi:N-acetylmuramoyl-L-alanine amidase [Bacillus toyonensis]|nr:N-acetylmuramoyl-L-alanine amidase [Bacillus toyonensis]PED21074.1 N-acetylmuramoyl-L-alanine amidase [Bacillus toyonensis]HDR7428988.1 N-acetylmuramoyl-L-alanine amidase [Bacillus toyonensis]
MSLIGFLFASGSTQYKAHNSKGKTYYVTANAAYVYVK